jgi:uncharacterized glyoxalase superfamily protein PhnB
MGAPTFSYSNLMAKKKDLLPSYTGQFRRRFSEQFDLMIPGKSREELEEFRQGLVKRGIAAGEIPNKQFYGHHLFCIKDPDGNGITIYTSHRIEPTRFLLSSCSRLGSKGR